MTGAAESVGGTNQSTTNAEAVRGADESMTGAENAATAAAAAAAAPIGAGAETKGGIDTTTAGASSGERRSFELTEIDHVAIAVRNLDAAVLWYKDTLGAVITHRERIESDGVEEALLKVADSYVQLLTPMRDDSPVAKYLERRGEGIHHVGYRVTDCAAALAAMKAAGATVIDAVPRAGSRGTTVAFVHPKSAFGTLVELVEE
jgi:methylmalonyl-CoA/ethylmalonyl-CoA epimerase